LTCKPIDSAIIGIGLARQNFAQGM